jgi:hypothetical protein
MVLDFVKKYLKYMWVRSMRAIIVVDVSIQSPCQNTSLLELLFTLKEEFSLGLKMQVFILAKKVST